MCGARGRDREGVIRRSRPRLLKLSILGLKIFAQDLDLKFSTRRHLRWGGGTLRAFRRPHLGCLEAWRAEWLGSFENQLKIANIDFLDTQKSSFGEVWEACLRVLGYLGESWCVPGVPGIHLGCVLERLGCVSEVSWGHLGTSWEDPVGVLASLRSFLGAFWAYFWKF